MRFILVDEILELRPGSEIKAVKTMQPEEELFRDHFPGFPVVPGVLLTEMMAQAAGKCLFAGDPLRGRPILAKIDSATFRDWVKPGQRLVICAQIRTSRAQVATAECHIDAEERRVAESRLLFTFIPHARFAPDYRDEVLERFQAKQGA